MLCSMLLVLGMAVSPVSRPAWTRRRAISALGQPRASRCWWSHAPSSADITPSFPGPARTVPDTACPCLSAGCHCASICRRGPAVRWEAVSEAGLGAVDEGPDLVQFQDEGGALRVGRLAQRDPAAGQFLGFQARAAD